MSTRNKMIKKVAVAVLPFVLEGLKNYWKNRKRRK